jgi:hypothetical protein
MEDEPRWTIYEHDALPARPSPEAEQRRATDDELIAAGIAAAREQGITGLISDTVARIIASQFHDGQASEMYSFASTGRIDREALAQEIFTFIFVGPDSEPENDKIEAFALYILETGDRDAVEGWNEATPW